MPPLLEHIESLLSGRRTPITVRRKVVDATFYSPPVPSTHTPKFSVAVGVRLVPRRVGLFGGSFDPVHHAHLALAQLALDALARLSDSAPALPLRVLELVARDKACEHPDKACHGDACPLACGFFDRLPAARAEAVAQAMRACLDAPVDTLNAFGAEGRARVRAMHDADTNAEELLRLFQRYAPG